MGWGQPKFFPGYTIKDLADLADQIDEGRWLWLAGYGRGGRPVHPSIVANMSLAVIRARLRDGHIKLAALNPKWEETRKEKASA